MFPCSALPELHALLKELRAATEAVERRDKQIIPNVFHRNGKPIRSFIRSWRAACETAGCPGLIPYDFCRTAVRNLVRAGVPERVAMQLTGHKTRSVFERYNVVAETDLREGVAKLALAATGTNSGTVAEIATVHHIGQRS